ncbi:coronin-7 isoform X3 [Bradysia coprophila]|uniref:coronin-7 isoform X3 n=1 Tax=Bradysia coprophila TaxID=38358 RepID=UPI00187D84A8|nr:coronin-7 isoform X3 [Bradysia coprophila]
MAWRFKASKYKNAAPIVPKPEVCVRDICVGSYQTYGNNIAASAMFMAFNWEHAGSSLAVLPIDDCGRKSKTMPLLHGHTDTVTDLHFSPFHDGLLATGSQDCLVKIWYIPEKGLETSLSNPECTFSHKQRRVETVGFHPTADYLLHSTSAGNVSLWDITCQKEVFANNEHPEVIQSLSWKLDGSIMATSCKDKMVRIIDPRAQNCMTAIAESHQSIKDSRVVWLGDQNRILTTGFDAARLRQIIIRDLRKFNVPEKTLELDCSTGVLMPLFDPDTNMLFLAGKGDTTISYMEVTDKDPHLIEGLRHNGEQTKGACLVPKRALRVMEGEVNRIMQLTSNSVIPIMYQVPRKTYRDFHADLYPDTNGFKTNLTCAHWLTGVNMPVPKMSLDPAKRELGDQPIVPRLGPKPFTSSNSDISFDKVFSVPQVPGADSTDMEHARDEKSFDSNDCKDDDEGVEKDVDVQDSTEKNGSEIEGVIINDYVESDSLEEDLQKAISTAERRKLTEDNSVKVFENNRSESESSYNGDGDKTENELRRMSLNRNSIAERKRLYENRSKSVQEEKPQSPLPLIRKDSLKSRNDNGKFNEKNRCFSADTNKNDDNGDEVFKKPNSNRNSKASEVSTATKRTSTVFGKVSKFRHLKGTPGHKSSHIENIRNISRQIPGECNGFHANHKRVAVPISGPGGKIAVYELSKPGRLPDGVIPSLVNGSNIMDFQWNPFDASMLAVACDDGIVKMWRIPDEGLNEPTNVPESELPAHSDKIYFIRFHPLAKNVLLTASYDMSIKLWCLETMTEKLCLKGHTDQIFDFAWSPCGVYGASVCKDGKIRIYNPRKSENPIAEGPGPVGTRGARISYAIEGHYILCTGFDKVSERRISIYTVNDLTTPLNTVGLDVAPAILMPFYDEDSSTLFVTGKGDSTIYAFEITDEAPHICPLSHHRVSTLHQGLSFLTKNHCDVTAVEFAKALRLTNNTIEPLSFTVPRIKNELFQDDLFPPTRVTWTETMSSGEWFSLKDKKVQKISLQPEGMESLSSIQPNPQPQNKSTDQTPNIMQTFNRHGNDFDKSKQDEIQKALSARMEYNTKLEQDDMEGVPDEEWNE